MKLFIRVFVLLFTGYSTCAAGPVLHLPAAGQKLLVMNEASAYPNPFYDNTTIYYNPGKSGNVAIKLYTQRGQLLGELFNDQVEAGQYYQFELDGSELNPGVYYYTIESNSGILHQRLELVR